MSFLLKILEISAIFNLSFKFFFFKNNLIYHKYLKYYETKLIATMLEWWLVIKMQRILVISINSSWFFFISFFFSFRMSPICDLKKSNIHFIFINYNSFLLVIPQLLGLLILLFKSQSSRVWWWKPRDTYNWCRGLTCQVWHPILGLQVW